MEKILIFEQNEIETLKSKANVILNKLREINDVFKTLDSKFADGLLTNDLTQIISNPHFLVDKIIGDNKDTKIGNLEIDIDKLREIVKLPSNANEFYKKREELFETMNPKYANPLRFDLGIYKAENGEIEINETVFNTYKDMFRIFVETKEQKETWQMLNDFLSYINKVKHLEGSILRGAFELKSSLFFEQMDGKYVFTENAYRLASLVK
jgi:hypothetical protein